MSLPTNFPWARVLGATAFRFGCYAVMLALLLWAETRAAPTLPDWMLERVPHIAWVERYNYWIWLLGYLPIALLLLRKDPLRFSRYMVSSGLLALARGLCVVATGLGPVGGQDVNAGLGSEWRVRAFWELVSPMGFFGRNTPQAFLTKDLFFSGHTSTTLLLWLYVWRYPRLRAAMAIIHGGVVASVFLGHLHYTIDVIAAYAVTFSLFVLREADLRQLLVRPANYTLPP